MTRSTIDDTNPIMLRVSVALSGTVDEPGPKLALVWNGVVEAIAGCYGRRGQVVNLPALICQDLVQSHGGQWQVFSFEAAQPPGLHGQPGISDYELSELDRQSIIQSRDGQQFEIVDGEVAGWVDGFRDEDGTTQAYGWAGDTALGKVAQRVLAFSGSELVATGITRVSRQDVADVFAAAGLQKSGFELALPQDTPLSCLRFFALSEAGTASELAVTPQGLLNTN